MYTINEEIKQPETYYNEVEYLTNMWNIKFRIFTWLIPDINKDYFWLYFTYLKIYVEHIIAFIFQIEFEYISIYFRK